MLPALALGLMITGFSAVPALADDDAASDYKIGRTDGTDTVYDVSMPKRFGDMLTCTTPEFAKHQQYCEQTSETVDGNPITLVRTSISWDKPMFERGSIAYGLFGQQWFSFDKSSQEWSEMVSLLQERGVEAIPGWWRADFVVVTSPASTDPPLRVPIPQPDLAVTAMEGLAKETVNGTYYQDVQVPKDIEAYRQQMLAYSNAGRNDPHFRLENGSLTATDLSLDEVVDKNGTRLKVYHDNEAPPYFNDQYLTAELNNAAQLQAEWDAHDSDHPPHTGPASYTDADGNTVNLYSLNDRAAYFDAPNIVEGLLPGPPGSAPFIWMKGDTHFKPFFNVEAFYPALGYGAAQGKDGTWHFAFVAQHTKEAPTKKLDEVALPITVTVGVTGPADGAGKVTINLPSDPDGTTEASASATPSGEASSSAPETASGENTGGQEEQGALAAVCEGFADYLRQEVASKEASLETTTENGAAECKVTTPDLTVAELSILPITGEDAASRLAVCENVQQGSTEGFSLGSFAGPPKVVDSSGSSGKSFTFLSSDVPGSEGQDQQVQAFSCVAEHEFWVRLDYQPGGLNRLLAVNATAEAMRRFEATQ